MVNKKIIGIPGWNMENSFGCGQNHLEYISTFGNPRIIMPWEERVECDMLYLPGGQDLNPSVYGATPSFKTSHTNVQLQAFYDKKLKLYVESNTPIFGVCLGFQMLCAYFGCSLEQNLKFHPQSPGRWEIGHEIKFNQTGKTAKVNSHHHQAVIYNPDPSLTGFNEKNLTMLAFCKDTGDGTVVEAMHHKKYPIISVQWHPKFFGAC